MKASSRPKKQIIDPYAIVLQEEHKSRREEKTELKERREHREDRKLRKEEDLERKEGRERFVKETRPIDATETLQKEVTKVKINSGQQHEQPSKVQLVSQTKGGLHCFLVEHGNAQVVKEVGILPADQSRDKKDKRKHREDKEVPNKEPKAASAHSPPPVVNVIEEDCSVFKKRNKKDSEVVVEIIEQKPKEKKPTPKVVEDLSKSTKSSSLKDKPVITLDGETKDKGSTKRASSPAKASKPEKSFVPKPARVEVLDDTPTKLQYRSTETRRLDSPMFDPLDHCPFDHGQPPPFFFICDGFQLISSLAGTDMVERKKRIFVNMLKAFEVMKSSQTADFYFFSTGRLDAEYIQGDLGVGDEILAKASAGATNCATKQIKEDLTKLGDLGTVVEKRKGKTQTMDQFFSKAEDNKRLTFEYVFKKINELTKISETLKKEALITELLVKATGLEAKYIIRFLQKGNFKMGCAKATIQSSLARCFFELLDPQKDIHGSADNWEKALQKCLHQYPNYRFIIQKMRESGGRLSHLYEKCRLTPGVPCKPMLAKPTKEINVIFSRFEGRPFTCEYKYDGLRGQIHYTKAKELFIYSRNLENMTLQYPDVCRNIESAIKPETEEFIIDSEIVGIDQKTGKILPFQTLMSRNKKNVEVEAIQNHVCVYIFDCLLLNGRSLLEKPLSQRREAFLQGFEKVENKVDFVVCKEADDFDSIQEFLNEAVEAGCEGLMVKKIQDDSQYEPCVRSFRWLKLKRDYLDQSLSDSLDLVVVGAKYGEGKRTGYFGTLLVASYNPDMERFETTGMVGSGFTEEHLRMFFERLSPKVIAQPHESVYQKDLTGNRKMDVWFVPELVVEILATDVQISPAYTCGFGKAQSDRGLGLRFPRFIKVRDDKTAEDCTVSQQVVEWYTQQASVVNAKGGKNSKPDDDDEEDDDY